MGQRRGLASSDVIKLNKMYRCNGEKPKPPAQPQPGNNYNQGHGFGGTNLNWGLRPQLAASFFRQLVSYFFQRNPRQSDENFSDPQNSGYGYMGRNSGYNGYNGYNNGYNGPYGGYGFKK